MTLVPKDEFLEIAKVHGFELFGEIKEHEREVSTGKRSVTRGVLRKI